MRLKLKCFGCLCCSRHHQQQIVKCRFRRLKTFLGSLTLPLSHSVLSHILGDSGLKFVYLNINVIQYLNLCESCDTTLNKWHLCGWISLIHASSCLQIVSKNRNVQISQRCNLSIESKVELHRKNCFLPKENQIAKLARFVLYFSMYSAAMS